MVWHNSQPRPLQRLEERYKKMHNNLMKLRIVSLLGMVSTVVPGWMDWLCYALRMNEMLRTWRCSRLTESHSDRRVQRWNSLTSLSRWVSTTTVLLVLCICDTRCVKKKGKKKKTSLLLQYVCLWLESAAYCSYIFVLSTLRILFSVVESRSVRLLNLFNLSGYILPYFFTWVNV